MQHRSGPDAPAPGDPLRVVHASPPGARSRTCVELTVRTSSRLVVSAAAWFVSLLLLVPLPAAFAPTYAPGVASLATDLPPAMPPVMTVHYAGDSLYFFRGDATS